MQVALYVWFKHILLVNTKGLDVAKLRRKPSVCFTKMHIAHLFRNTTL